MAPFGAAIALISVLAMQAGAQNDLVCFPGSNPQKCCNVANSHNGADKSFARAKVSVDEPVEPSVEPRHRVNVNLTYFDTFAGPPAGKWTPITWKDLWLAHGRKLHVVLIGEDRDTFIHVHPDDYAVIADDETSFDVYVSFPRSGKYLVLIDYVLISEDLEMCIDEEAAHAHSSNGKTAVNIANKVTIEVTGAGPAMVPSAVYDTYKYRTTPASDQEAKDKYTLPVNIASFEEECCEDKAGCYEIELVITSHAGMDHGRRRAWNPSGNLGGDFLVVNTSECLMVDAIVKDAVTKEPIRTMTPYLNAAAHMVLVPEDPTAKPIHMHGMLPEDMAAVMTMESMMTCSHIDASAFDDEKEYVFGPVVQSMVAIFNPGPYSLYVTFAIGDKIVNTRFQILAGKAVDGVEGGAWELPEGLCMTSPSSCGMAPPEVDPSCAAKVADAQASLYAPLNFATGAPVVADTSAPTAAPTAAVVCTGNEAYMTSTSIALTGVTGAIDAAAQSAMVTILAAGTSTDASCWTVTQSSTTGRRLQQATVSITADARSQTLAEATALEASIATVTSAPSFVPSMQASGAAAYASMTSATVSSSVSALAPTAVPTSNGDNIVSGNGGGVEGPGGGLDDEEEVVVETDPPTAAPVDPPTPAPTLLDCGPGMVNVEGACTDVNACTAAPCSPLAECKDEPAPATGYTCACGEGYAGSGEGPTGCEDVNECDAAPCGADASCTNSAGSFTCACDSGFRGDGFSCVLVSSCSDNRGGCDSLAECCQGAFDAAGVCQADPLQDSVCGPCPGCDLAGVCTGGYEGSGDSSCVDVDGCAAEPCFKDSYVEVACEDVPAPGTGRACGACPVGYKGTGATCEPCQGALLAITDSTAVDGVITRSKDIQLYSHLTNFEAACENSGWDFKWSTVTSTDPDYTLKLTSDNLCSTRNVYVPKGTLPVGETYTFTLTARLRGSDHIKLIDVREISVINTPLVALVQGGGVKGEADNVVIDASASYDPDGLPGDLAFTWICTATNGNCLGADGRDALANVGPADAALTLRLLGGEAGAAITYTFSVVVSKGGRETAAASPAVVEVTKGPRPQVNITSIGSASVNSDAKLTLSSTVVSAAADAGGDLARTWSVSPSLDLENSDVAFVSAGGDNLVLAAGVLAPGETYAFTHRAEDSNGEGTAVVYVYANRPPAGGAIAVSVAEGLAADTVFEISTDGDAWEDADGPGPLQYLFGYQVVGESEETLLGDYTPMKETTAILPAGLAEHGHAVTVFCRARDGLEAVAVQRAESVVTVTTPTFNDAAEEEAFVEDGTSSAQAMLDAGDSDGTQQACDAMLAFINSQEGDATARRRLLGASGLRGRMRQRAALLGTAQSAAAMSRRTPTGLQRSAKTMLSAVAVPEEVDGNTQEAAVAGAEDILAGGDRLSAGTVSALASALDRIGAASSIPGNFIPDFEGEGVNATVVGATAIRGGVARGADGLAAAALVGLVPGEPGLEVAGANLQLSASRNDATAASPLFRPGGLRAPGFGAAFTLPASLLSAVPGFASRAGVDAVVRATPFSPHGPGARDGSAHASPVVALTLSSAGAAGQPRGAGAEGAQLRGLSSGLDVSNLDEPIVFQVPLDADVGGGANEARCSFWDEEAGEFSEDGCFAMPNPRPANATLRWATPFAINRTFEGSARFSRSWEIEHELLLGCTSELTEDGYVVFVAAGRRLGMKGWRCAIADPLNGIGCHWNTSAQAFSGPACVSDDVQQCMCNHLTEFVLTMGVPKIKVAGLQDLALTPGDIWRIKEMVVCVLGIIAVGMLGGALFKLKTMRVNRRTLEAVFDLPAGFKEGLGTGAWTWHFKQVIQRTVVDGAQAFSVGGPGPTLTMALLMPYNRIRACIPFGVCPGTEVKSVDGKGRLIRTSTTMRKRLTQDQKMRLSYFGSETVTSALMNLPKMASAATRKRLEVESIKDREMSGKGKSKAAMLWGSVSGSARGSTESMGAGSASTIPRGGSSRGSAESMGAASTSTTPRGVSSRGSTETMTSASSSRGSSVENVGTPIGGHTPMNNPHGVQISPFSRSIAAAVDRAKGTEKVEGPGLPSAPPRKLVLTSYESVTSSAAAAGGGGAMPPMMKAGSAVPPILGLSKEAGSPPAPGTPGAGYAMVGAPWGALDATVRRPTTATSDAVAPPASEQQDLGDCEELSELSAVTPRSHRKDMGLADAKESWPMASHTAIDLADATAVHNNPTYDAYEEVGQSSRELVSTSARVDLDGLKVEADFEGADFDAAESARVRTPTSRRVGREDGEGPAFFGGRPSSGAGVPASFMRSSSGTTRFMRSSSGTIPAPPATPPAPAPAPPEELEVEDLELEEITMQDLLEGVGGDDQVPPLPLVTQRTPNARTWEHVAPQAPIQAVRRASQTLSTPRGDEASAPKEYSAARAAEAKAVARQKSNFSVEGEVMPAGMSAYRGAVPAPGHPRFFSVEGGAAAGAGLRAYGAARGTRPAPPARGELEREAYRPPPPANMFLSNEGTVGDWNLKLRVGDEGASGSGESAGSRGAARGRGWRDSVPDVTEEAHLHLEDVDMDERDEEGGAPEQWASPQLKAYKAPAAPGTFANKRGRAVVVDSAGDALRFSAEAAPVGKGEIRVATLGELMDRRGRTNSLVDSAYGGSHGGHEFDGSDVGGGGSMVGSELSDNVHCSASQVGEPGYIVPRLPRFTDNPPKFGGSEVNSAVSGLSRPRSEGGSAAAGGHLHPYAYPPVGTWAPRTPVPFDRVSENPVVQRPSQRDSTAVNIENVLAATARRPSDPSPRRRVSAGDEPEPAKAGAGKFRAVGQRVRMAAATATALERAHAVADKRRGQAAAIADAFVLPPVRGPRGRGKGELASVGALAGSDAMSWWMPLSMITDLKKQDSVLQAEEAELQAAAKAKARPFKPALLPKKSALKNGGKSMGSGEFSKLLRPGSAGSGMSDGEKATRLRLEVDERDQVVGTAMALALIALRGLIAEEQLQQEVRRSAAFLKAETDDALSYDLEGLVDFFRVVTWLNVVKPKGWYERSRVFSLVLLQRNDGGFLPTMDVAQALFSQDEVSEVQVDVKRFDIGAIERSIPVSLLDAEAGGLLPGGGTALKVWTTLLCCAALEDTRLDWVVQRAEEAPPGFAGPTPDNGIEETLVSRSHAYIRHHLGRSGAAAALVPGLRQEALAQTRGWHEAQKLVFQELARAVEARRKALRTWKDRAKGFFKTVFKFALHSHRLLNWIVAPRSPLFTRTQQSLLLSTIWLGALVVAIWFYAERSVECCLQAAEFVGCGRRVPGEDTPCEYHQQCSQLLEDDRIKGFDGGSARSLLSAEEGLSSAPHFSCDAFPNPSYFSDMFMVCFFMAVVVFPPRKFIVSMVTLSHSAHVPRRWREWTLRRKFREACKKRLGHTPAAARVEFMAEGDSGGSGKRVSMRGGEGGGGGELDDVLYSVTPAPAPAALPLEAAAGVAAGAVAAAGPVLRYPESGRYALSGGERFRRYLVSKAAVFAFMGNYTVLSYFIFVYANKLSRSVGKGEELAFLEQWVYYLAVESFFLDWTEAVRMAFFRYFISYIVRVFNTVVTPYDWFESYDDEVLFKTLDPGLSDGSDDAFGGDDVMVVD